MDLLQIRRTYSHLILEHASSDWVIYMSYLMIILLYEELCLRSVTCVVKRGINIPTVGKT